jgi:hypothetical protein
MDKNAKTAYTPGPWRLVPGKLQKDGTLGVPSVYQMGRDLTAVGWEIATMGGYLHEPGGHERMMADAHLISAAPELLEALKGMLQACVFVGDGAEAVVMAAKCAVARAEGRRSLQSYR